MVPRYFILLLEPHFPTHPSHREPVRAGSIRFLGALDSLFLRRVPPKKLLDLGRSRELEVAAVADSWDEFPIVAARPAELFIVHARAREKTIDSFKEQWCGG
jgi:hypothetical protein